MYTINNDLGFVPQILNGLYKSLKKTMEWKTIAEVAFIV